MKNKLRVFYAALFIDFCLASCNTCKWLATTIEDRLAKDSQEYEIPVGHRIDEKGNFRKEKQVWYSKSEIRLLRALDDVCKGSSNERECEELLEDYEERVVYPWFEEQGNSLVDSWCFKYFDCAKDEL